MEKAKTPRTGSLEARRQGHLRGAEGRKDRRTDHTVSGDGVFVRALEAISAFRWAD